MGPGGGLRFYGRESKPGSLALSDLHFLMPFIKSLSATVVSVISKEALTKAYLGSGPKPDKLKPT